MRKYYHCRHVAFPYIQNNPQIEAFTKKYMWRDMDSFVYRPIFGKDVVITGIFFWEENDRFFEFFTGIELGRKMQTWNCVENDYDVYISGPYELGFFVRTANSDRKRAYERTASEFAYEISPYMNHKTHLEKIMRRYLELLHIVYTQKRQREYMYAQAKYQRENQDAGWLEQYLDKRSCK